MRGQIRAQEREIRMLQRAGLSTASAELLLSRMRAKVDDLCRDREALLKAPHGLGHWDRAPVYAPALYDPATWKERTQTAVQRAGLWIMKLIEDAKRPLTRAELESILRKRGLIPENGSRAYVGYAVGEFVDEIVYLEALGYWLAKRPWPAAGYSPRSAKGVRGGSARTRRR
ncbi:hypothetical protein ABIF69_004492 [Bradyrhizobium japonicum]